MTVVRRPGVLSGAQRSEFADARRTLSLRLLALGKVIALAVGALALAGIMSGAMRPSLSLILVGWVVLSLAATGLFALSRVGDRR